MENKNDASVMEKKDASVMEKKDASVMDNEKIMWSFLCVG